MKFRHVSIVCFAALVLVAGSTRVSTQVTSGLSINRIEGRVVDQSNAGVNNAYVELYDTYGSMVARQRSTEDGRFSFRGMAAGQYTVSVKPFGTNLKEDTKDIEVNNQYSRSDTVQVEFRLMPDKRFQSSIPSVVGTIFAQDVPPDAERRYKVGIESFESKPEQALLDLQEAIKLFPRYFNALAALGKAYIVRGKYETGYPYLLTAIDVNTRCGDCYYSLAIAFYKLNQLPAATKAIDAAVLLQPGTPAVYLLQGIIYRLNNDLLAAEKSLLTAKTLFKEPNPEVHWQLSLVYNRLKRNKEAADQLELYLKAKPDINKEEKESVLKLIAKLRDSKS
jgi:tetratricopeptide (TPR) repeat protein